MSYAIFCDWCDASGPLCTFESGAIELAEKWGYHRVKNKSNNLLDDEWLWLCSVCYVKWTQVA